MSDERLSDEEVAWWAAGRAETTHGPAYVAILLAREVQERRKNDWANDLAHLKLSADMLAVRDLCARHDITVEGIVALVEWAFDERNDWDSEGWSHFLRRLARGEDA